MGADFGVCMTIYIKVGASHEGNAGYSALCKRPKPRNDVTPYSWMHRSGAPTLMYIALQVAKSAPTLTNTLEQTVA